MGSAWTSQPHLSFLEQLLRKTCCLHIHYYWPGAINQQDYSNHEPTKSEQP